MGFRDGKIGDIFVELVIGKYLMSKYEIDRVAIELKGNWILIRSSCGLNKLHQDHCMRVKRAYVDYDDVYHNVLEFEQEYFLGKMVDWLKSRC